jgi:hypothetical protein
MEQTHDEITQNLAERLCWEVARRDDSRVARRLYRKQLVDGVYRLDAGALLDDFLHFLQAIGVRALWEEAQGAAIHSGDPRDSRCTAYLPWDGACRLYSPESGKLPAEIG